MRIVTYLGFTLLSILIQFSVMDFIHSIMQNDEQIVDMNSSRQKRQLRDVLKSSNLKPHALYYQTQMNTFGKDSAPAKIYDNTTLPDLLTSITTAVFEDVYDENSEATDPEETSLTTETVYTSTEFDNVTEITFFGKPNQTSKLPTKAKKRNTDCKCDFLYKVCDTHCCCDNDCSDVETNMFPNCTKNRTSTVHHDDICYTPLLYFGRDGPIATVLNDWFCIVKVNLPARTSENNKIHLLKPNNLPTWKYIEKPIKIYEFTNKIYEYGDPIWLLKNGSIYYIDLPSPLMNSYCTRRKTLQFLKDHKFSCRVKINDLEMLKIMKSSTGANVISATPLSMNSTYLDCSTLHCVNWTHIICENLNCGSYNESIHEPTCTESSCTNLALKLEYIFNYYNSTITNATIKYHIKKVSTDLHFMTQEIDVKFVLTNESIDQVLKVSGNPGYIQNLPLVVSYAENNFTDMFYNKSAKMKKYLTLTENKDGTCVASNYTDNYVLFGINRRLKCRYYHKYSKLQNSTDQCKTVQNDIFRLLDLKNLLVSPLGDPQNLKDNDWIPLDNNISAKNILYGELHNKSSKLYCYNIITRFSIIFSFAYVDGNRIVGVTVDSMSRNASFDIDNMSVIITIDVNFLDVTKPSFIEYATGPNLHFYLPNDFFYPFPSNESQLVSVNVCCLIIYCCVAILASK